MVIEPKQGVPNNVSSDVVILPECMAQHIKHYIHAHCKSAKINFTKLTENKYEI